MATLTTVLSTPFTPAVGDFDAQVSGGSAFLERRQTSGAAFVPVARIDRTGVIVANPVAGASYRFVSENGSPSVQADQ